MGTQYLEPVKLLAITTHKFEPIMEETKELRLTLWPNPAQQYFTLKLSDIPANCVPYLTVISITGKLTPIQVPAIRKGQNELTMQIQANEYGLEAGLYVVNVNFNGKNYHSKILIQP